MSTRDLLEDLAIPYVAVLTSVERGDDWVRRAEYPELAGCYVETKYALDAMEQLDEVRIRMIMDMHDRGEAPPRPRPPLKALLARLEAVARDGSEDAPST